MGKTRGQIDQRDGREGKGACAGNGGTKEPDQPTAMSLSGWNHCQALLCRLGGETIVKSG